MTYFAGLTEWVAVHLGLDAEMQGRIVASGLIILCVWLINWIVLRVVARRFAEYSRAIYEVRRTSHYIAVAIALLLLARVWLNQFLSIATFLGLFSAGLVIALKDLLVDLAGWLFIIWRRPFGVGDRIEIDGRRGDVVDQRIFQFTLFEIGNWVDADQPTGRLVHVPNGKVFSDSVANYTRSFPFIWDEIPVLITFESDWETAKSLLTEIVKRHGEAMTQVAEDSMKVTSRRFLIPSGSFQPAVYTTVEDSGILLTLRYLCDPRGRRGSAEAIWEDILRTFAGYSNIDFAYPTQRLYNNAREGKPATRPDALYQ